MIDFWHKPCSRRTDREARRPYLSCQLCDKVVVKSSSGLACLLARTPPHRPGGANCARVRNSSLAWPLFTVYITWLLSLHSHDVLSSTSRFPYVPLFSNNSFYPRPEKHDARSQCSPLDKSGIRHQGYGTPLNNHVATQIHYVDSCFIRNLVGDLLHRIELLQYLLRSLSKFPGPKLRAISILPSLRTIWQGSDAPELLALHAQYGPVVRTGPNHLSYANGISGFKEIYGFGKKGLYKDPQLYSTSYNKVHNIITGGDAEHSRQRKILSHAFSDRALKEQEPLMKRWASLMEAKMGEAADAGKNVAMLKFYNCTTFDVMGDLTFAEDLGMLRGSEYSPWVTTIFYGPKRSAKFRTFKLHSKFANWLVEELVLRSDKVRQSQLEHWNYSKERVDSRLDITPGRPDLWTKILAKGAPEDKEGLSFGEHHANASLFMIAGTETTATALSGTTHHLLCNPDKLSRLQEEVRSAFTSTDDMDLETLQKQKYLMAALQEGFRMYPPFPTELPRVVTVGGATICGDHLPEGTTLGVHHLATYRNEELFRKPYEFHPERWLGDPEFQDDMLDALEPFSFGPRNCLGKVSEAYIGIIYRYEGLLFKQNLAWHELRLLLSVAILNFDMELCEESQGWHDQKVFTVWEKKPMTAKLHPVVRTNIIISRLAFSP
jgi:cytochrome P450